MDHIPDEGEPEVARAAHAVIDEAKDAGVYLFAGGLDEDVEPVMVAGDGTVTASTYPQTKELWEALPARLIESAPWLTRPCLGRLHTSQPAHRHERAVTLPQADSHLSASAGDYLAPAERAAGSHHLVLAGRSQAAEHRFDQQDDGPIGWAGGSQRAQTLSHADRHGATATGYHNGSHR
jgi:hypothetical protein